MVDLDAWGKRRKCLIRPRRNVRTRVQAAKEPLKSLQQHSLTLFPLCNHHDKSSSSSFIVILLTSGQARRSSSLTRPVEKKPTRKLCPFAQGSTWMNSSISSLFDYEPRLDRNAVEQKAQTAWKCSSRAFLGDELLLHRGFSPVHDQVMLI